MIVKDFAHARLVKKRIEEHWKRTSQKDITFDVETKAKRGFGTDDALIIGRADVNIFSLCYRGESYSFPTSLFSVNYPDAEEWGEFFEDWFVDPEVVVVMHNANYDVNNGAHYSMGVPVIINLWDTMIGAWKASEYYEKGLKARASLYSRVWRETKSVDFSNLEELAEYAEQDVIQTDELYQMQVYGEVNRPASVSRIAKNGTLIKEKSKLPPGKLVIPSECLRTLDKLWLRYLEFPVLRATMRAERRGFPIDVTSLYEIRTKLASDLRACLKTMYRMAGRMINLNSGPQLAKVCAELNIENPYKTKKGKDCFNAKALAKLQGVHPFIDALSKYKALEQMSRLYIGTKDFDGDYSDTNCGLEYYVAVDGRIHCTLGTVGAVTGRHGSSNPNLQNIPARKDSYALKSCFTAVPKTFKILLPRRHRRPALLCVLDYAQLEIRIMALLSKDENMTKVLRNRDGDIHQHTADEFGVSRDPQAKNLNFLLLYAGGAYMLAENLSFMGVPTSPGEAEVFRELHVKTYPKVAEYRLELLRHHREHGYVKLFTGRRRTLPDIDWDNPRSVHKAETTLSNNVVQGTGQDFLKAAIVRADYNCINPDRMILSKMDIALKNSHRLYLKDKAEQVDKYRRILKKAEAKYILQVHDEMVFTVLPSAAEEVLGILADIMSWRHYFPGISGYNVPLVAEGGVGHNWKEAKSKDKYLYHVKSGFVEFEKYN